MNRKDCILECQVDKEEAVEVKIMRVLVFE